MLRLDECPPGLVLVVAHGDVSGGLAWKSQDQHIDHVEAVWHLSPYELADHWGESLVAIPRTLAAATKDPAIRAWAKSNINQEEN